MLNVSPDNKFPSHNITLSDKNTVVGINAYRGQISNIRSTPSSPSTLQLNNAGSKYGDWDPANSHIEQKTWIGGRGSKDYTEDDSKYYSGKNIWTLSDKMIYPLPQQYYCRGLRDSDFYMPGFVKWKMILDNAAYMDQVFTAGATYTAEKLSLWLRRKGNPGTLTVSIYSDSAGDPDTELVSDTVTYSDIDEYLSQLIVFDLSSLSLTSGNTYHIIVASSSTDKLQNHWLIATDGETQSMKISSDGVTYAYPDEDTKMYYRVRDADTKQTFIFFRMSGATFAIDQKASKGNSTVYIHGDIGMATSGGTSSVTDTAKTWDVDQYIGAEVKIVAGTGEGQIRTISSNTSTVLSVSEAFDITPDTTSQYVIYGTPYWKDTGITVGGYVSSVAVYNDIANLALGSSIKRIRYDTIAKDFDTYDDANAADFLCVFQNPAAGTQLWKAVRSTSKIDYAAAVAWDTSHSFSASEVQVGDASSKITNLVIYNDALWIFKEDSLWFYADSAVGQYKAGLDAIPSQNNGHAVATQNLYLLFSWSYSIERIYSDTIDDIGPWSGDGLPEDRKGMVKSLFPAIGWLFCCVDAGTSGYSSILATAERSWNEFFVAPEAGLSIDSLFWEPIEEGNPQLLFSMGGDICFIKFPKNDLNPSHDSTLEPCHEAVIILSPIDMGAAELDKSFKEMNVTTENPDVDPEIYVDYQTDSDIGSNTWYTAGAVGPDFKAELKISEIKRICLRLRIYSSSGNIPKTIATVLEGFTRTPSKDVINIKTRVADIQYTKQGKEEVETRKKLAWLKNAASKAIILNMRSNIPEFDDMDVILEPFSKIPESRIDSLDKTGYILNLNLREA